MNIIGIIAGTGLAVAGGYVIYCQYRELKMRRGYRRLLRAMRHVDIYEKMGKGTADEWECD